MNQTRFQIHKASLPPLRADPRAPGQGAPHDTRGSPAELSPGGLLRSTLLAGGAALAILVGVVLPAEYGVDPTGAGRLLGLTEMGAIKVQLRDEAAADDAEAAGLAAAPQTAADPGIDARLGAIEAQLERIAIYMGADEPPLADAARDPDAPGQESAEAPEPAAAPPTETAEVGAMAAAPPAAPELAPASEWRDEEQVTLDPGQGVELKLVMDEGATARFQWTANGSVLNYDTHGDASGQSISYEKGRGVADQEGTLTAAFSGNHGWFWRNRTDAPVTMTFRAAGDYSELKRTY